MPGNGGGNPSATAPDLGRRVTTVLVVDDHPLLRSVVRLECERAPDVVIVGEAGDGREALAEFRRLRPDVVVLDLNLPVVDGLEVAHALRREERPPRVLVLTGRADDEAVYESLQADVAGILDKATAPGRVLEAIRTVASGGRVLTPAQERTALRLLADFVTHTREASRISASVTAREVDVLRLLSRGLTTREMAARLLVSTGTIESHIGRIYKKLGVRTRVEAVAKAGAMGLIDLKRELASDAVAAPRRPRTSLRPR